MFTFGLYTISCVFSDVLIKYLFYTDIFLNTYLCMKFSMYTVFAKAKPFEVTS